MAPDSVRAAYQYYWQRTQTARDTARQDEHRMTTVNTLLHDFGQDDLNKDIYTAAMLGPFIDRTDDYLTSRNALRALKQYSTYSSTTADESAYVLGILGDRRATRGYWNRSLCALHAGDTELLPLLLDQSNLMPVSDELWIKTDLLKGVDTQTAVDYFVALDEHVQDVNIESLLISAVEEYVWLTSDEPSNDSQTFQHVHKTEVFLAPICEFIGFDGLASALRSESLKRRLINSGNDMYINDAAKLLQSLGDDTTVEQQTQRMIEAALGDNLHEAVITNNGKHDILIGEGICMPETRRITWRRKSLGSLAYKLYEDKYSEQTGSQHPMDIVAATVVVDSEDEVADIVAHIVARIQTDSRTTPKPSPSREQALHITGRREYIEAIKASLEQAGIDTSSRTLDEKPVETKAFHVTKFTFIYQEWQQPIMPVEVMVTTSRDRREARVGVAAHVLYKLGVKPTAGIKTAPLVGAFHNLRSRRDWLGHNHLTDKSRARGREFGDLIDAIPL